MSDPTSTTTAQLRPLDYKPLRRAQEPNLYLPLKELIDITNEELKHQNAELKLFQDGPEYREEYSAIRAHIEELEKQKADLQTGIRNLPTAKRMNSTDAITVEEDSFFEDYLRVNVRGKKMPSSEAGVRVLQSNDEIGSTFSSCTAGVPQDNSSLQTVGLPGSVVPQSNSATDENQDGWYRVLGMLGIQPPSADTAREETATTHDPDGKSKVLDWLSVDEAPSVQTTHHRQQTMPI